MLPLFLFVFLMNLHQGANLLDSIVYAGIAALTGPIGILFTLAWLGDTYEWVSMVLIVLVYGVAGLMMLSLLTFSGYEIYKLFRRK